jgi:hypothetical protein
MYEPVDILERGDGKVGLVFECAMCGEIAVVEVSEKAWEKRAMGGMVQDCFPDLPAAQRELFVSGTCPKCWEKTFGPGPEQEEPAEQEA